MKQLILSFVLLITTINSISGQSHRDSYYKKNPVWIDLIKDNNVNYFEAIKAYELFWSNKKKPKVENDIIGQTKNTTGEKESEQLSKKERRLYNQFALEIKKFEAWKKSVLPFVQADGRILSADERLKLWEETKK